MKFRLLLPHRGELSQICALWMLLLIGAASRAGAQGLYVGSAGGYVGIYSEATESVINPNLISNLQGVPSTLLISGNVLYTANSSDGMGRNDEIGTFNLATGVAINTGFITGLNSPEGLAISGSRLYVSSELGSTVGVYDAATGATINANFISGLSVPFRLAISGNNLYVTDPLLNRVGVYDATSGAAINANLITGVTAPEGLTLSGNTLYVVDGNTVGEYDATTGAALSGNLITGLNHPTNLAIYGNDLFVVNFGSGNIGKYDATTGAQLGTNLTPAWAIPESVAIGPVPEPGGFALVCLGAFGILPTRRRRC